MCTAFGSQKAALQGLLVQWQIDRGALHLSLATRGVAQMQAHSGRCARVQVMAKAKLTARHCLLGQETASIELGYVPQSVLRQLPGNCKSSCKSLCGAPLGGLALRS